MASLLRPPRLPGDQARRGGALARRRRRVVRARSLALLIFVAQVSAPALLNPPDVFARRALTDDFRGPGNSIKTARRFAQDQARPSNPSSALTGQVVDARTGEPMSKVKIIVVGSEARTTTDERGIFTLQNLPPGPIELYITTVTYGLVRRIISPGERENAAGVRVALNQEAATLTEQVTVTAAPFAETETNAASEQTLNKAELQTLSSVIAGDPLRAAQSLPSVTANDDFRSDFAVRGAGFRRVGVYLDGVLTDNFVHTVQGNFPDTGSLSVINADTLSAVTLFSGAFPAKFGHRTAAVLNLETRDGNRVKPAGRLAASLSSTSGVVDGPFARGRGSWLVAARKSYLGYLVRRVNEANDSTNDSVFDFADVQGKAIYDLTPRHRVGASAIFGTFQFDRERARDQLGINSLREADSRNLLVNAYWSYTPDPRLLVGARVFALRSDFTNRNRDRLILDDGQRTQVGARGDVNYLWRAAHRIEAGLYLRSIRGERLTERFAFSQPAPRDVMTFARRATEQGYYAQDTWSSERFGLSATGGARVEHSGLTGETLVSPRAALGFAPSGDWRLRAAFGRHYQFPDFEDFFGRLGNPDVRAERATHYNASVERTFGTRTRVLVEVYDREDSNLLFSLSEPRVEAGRITFAEFPVRNALRGHARGVELTLQRRSANNLTGWVSYSYAKTRLRDGENDLSFVSDFDQRHSVNTYASYRFTETFNLSGQWRYGGGVPIPGFFRRDASGVLFLASERNLVRVPAYSRLDVRANKAFLFKKWKLTLTGEVINALNRENLRYAGFDGYGSDGRVFGRLDRMLPILPSAGIVIEF